MKFVPYCGQDIFVSRQACLGAFPNADENLLRVGVGNIPGRKNAWKAGAVVAVDDDLLFWVQLHQPGNGIGMRPESQLDEGNVHRQFLIFPVFRHDQAGAYDSLPRISLTR